MHQKYFVSHNSRQDMTSKQGQDERGGGHLWSMIMVVPLIIAVGREVVVMLQDHVGSPKQF